MKKMNKWVILILGVFVLVVILFLIFGREKSFTVTFNSDGGTKISDVDVKKGEKLKLPDPPTKKGYRFVGWTDENGNAITNDTIVKKDINVKAMWQEQYVCPEDCTPNEDGKTCTKVVEIWNLPSATPTSCPDGFEGHGAICRKTEIINCTKDE